jgi:UDP-N-acetylmuramoyl-tripeptide--D-alanyl-D-alanine ligase
MAIKLNISITDITKTLKTLKSPAKRFELKRINKTTIVDNTYNSNPVSFIQTIESAKSVKGKKALITPGLAELGKEEINIHAKLAKQTNSFDQIILVGKNKRTKAFYSNLNNKKLAKFIPDTRESYQNSVNELINKKYNWIFLENDLPQNY